MSNAIVRDWADQTRRQISHTPMVIDQGIRCTDIYRQGIDRKVSTGQVSSKRAASQVCYVHHQPTHPSIRQNGSPGASLLVQGKIVTPKAVSQRTCQSQAIPSSGDIQVGDTSPQQPIPHAAAYQIVRRILLGQPVPDPLLEFHTFTLRCRSRRQL